MNVRACPVCATPSGAPFLELPRVPVHANRLPATRSAALAVERANMALCLCAGCGLVFNALFDPNLLSYGPGYETSLFASPTFRAHAESEVRRLVETLGMRGREVLEIGCGDGAFLRLMARLGDNRCVGIDPSLEPDEVAFSGGGSLRLVAADYRQAWPDHPADLILCRHVLEHLQAPLDLLATVRRALDARPDARVVFEVPDARHSFERGGVWDLIYEHFAYFTPTSLANTFERARLRPLRVASSFGGQFLGIDAEAGGGDPTDRSETLAAERASIERFGDAHAEHVAERRERLAAYRDARVALWGAGSKGVTFLNALDPDGARITTVVDASTRKQGRHVPGTGQRIVAPRSLRDDAPDVVLVTNPQYVDEIRATLAELAVAAEVAAV